MGASAVSDPVPAEVDRALPGREFTQGAARSRPPQAASNPAAIRRACGCCGTALANAGQSVRDRLHHTPGAFRLVRCAFCGHGQLGQALNEEQVRVAYPETYMARGLTPRTPRSLRGRLMSRLIGERMESRRVALVRRFVDLGPGVRVLDVGCGCGGFLAGVERLTGAKAMGVDPDAGAVDQARATGFDARQGTLLGREWGALEFDLLTMWHVLEHTADPLRELLAAREALKPGGHLFCMVPNARSWSARIFGGAWYGLDVPRHLQHFSMASLLLLAERAGFMPLKTATEAEFSMIGASLHNLLGLRWADDLEGNLFRWLGLQLAFMPLDWTANLLGQGDSLLLVAKKNVPSRGRLANPGSDACIELAPPI